MRILTIALAYALQGLLLIWLVIGIFSAVSKSAGHFIGFGVALLVALIGWFLVVDPVMEWTRRRF